MSIYPIVVFQRMDIHGLFPIMSTYPTVVFQRMDIQGLFPIMSTYPTVVFQRMDIQELFPVMSTYPTVVFQRMGIQGYLEIQNQRRLPQYLEEERVQQRKILERKIPQNLEVYQHMMKLMSPM